MNITLIWTWIVSHQAELIAAAGALWTAVSIIVRLTPTPVDDEYLSRAREAFERISFFQPQNVQGLLSVPGKKAKRPPKA